MTSTTDLPLSQRAYTGDEPDDVIRRMIVGESAAMRRVRALVRAVAPSDASVLISGPTGSGKELVARAIHAAGQHPDGPFVAINCGAIPAELIESELFGHERGAFTGATERRTGRFEAAAGGTLLLDEIGDMPLAAQVRLLRVLEERRFCRVGGSNEIRFTGRIIAASHCDLPAHVAAGRFRADLWYRLAVAIIGVPALAERHQDIPALIASLSRSIDWPARFSGRALLRLAEHDWPGNVRELRSVLVRAALFHPPGLGPVDAPHIAALIGADAHAMALDQAPEDDDLRALLVAVERRHLVDALRRADGVVADAARLSGINRTTFVEKMRRHGLTRSEAIGRTAATICRDSAPIIGRAVNLEEPSTLSAWQSATR